MARRAKNEQSLETHAACLHGRTEERLIRIEKGAPGHGPTPLEARLLSAPRRQRARRSHYGPGWREKRARPHFPEETRLRAAPRTAAGPCAVPRALARARTPRGPKKRRDAPESFQERFASDRRSERSGVGHRLNIISVVDGRQSPVPKQCPSPLNASGFRRLGHPENTRTPFAKLDDRA